MGKLRTPALIAGAALLLIPAFVPMAFSASGSACGPSTVNVQTVADGGAQNVAGYSGDQLLNAAHIMNAATVLGLPEEAQIIGVMVAMGESSLKNITYGDDIVGVKNPDGTPTSSVGLFQQQTWWGSYADRMDPEKSATLFFGRLATVPGWQDMQPSAAAHKVQRNADPNHYTKYLQSAVDVVAALSGSTTDGTCGASTGEWIRPVDGPMTSPYGPRGLICNGAGCSKNFHEGIDFGNACGTPIKAASGGQVTFVGNAGAFGNRVIIDHGQGVESVYGHISPGSFKVKPGDTVAGGTVIADVGATGVVSGCHLDLKIQLNGKTTDPQKFLEEHGVKV